MISISKDSDSNYLASVVIIQKFENHPNADKLQIVKIFGNNVIVAKDLYKEGEKMVYFPVESCLNLKFLSWANLLNKPELNADKKTSGYFDIKGRVKAVSLRQIPSQGFLYRVSDLAKYYNISEDEFILGKDFDTINDDIVVTKYIKHSSKKQSENSSNSLKKTKRKIDEFLSILPRPIRKIVGKPINGLYNHVTKGVTHRIKPNYFKFHYKTEHLGRNIYCLNPDDDIHISSKLHGTSAIYGYLPVKNMFGFYKHKLVYSSRSIIKNRKDGKYTDDVWGIHAKQIQDQFDKINSNIFNNITLYGEIVGYTPSGKFIQKNYDYGLPVGKSEFLLYRATFIDDYTNIAWDLGVNSLKDFCDLLKIKMVPTYYTGLAKDLFPEIKVDSNWHNNFLDALHKNYLDKTCEICSTGVINEGIVLKINSHTNLIPTFKFKSPKFLINESKQRDNNEYDMEEEN